MDISHLIGNLFGEAAALSRIANIYKHLNSYTKAIKYYKDALQIFQKLEAKDGQQKTLFNMGCTYYQQKKYSSALKSLQAALFFAQDINNTLAQVGTSFLLAATCHQLNYYPEAKSYYFEAKEIYNRLNNNTQMQEIAEQLNIALSFEETINIKKGDNPPFPSI